MYIFNGMAPETKHNQPGMNGLSFLRKSSDPSSLLNTMGFEIPLDITNVCATLGINIEYSDSNEFNVDVLVSSTLCEILINPYLPQPKSRYYGALALGICILCPPGRYRVTSKILDMSDISSPLKLKDSIYGFAYNILVPPHMLPLDTKYGVSDIPKLADQFGIPHVPMAMIYGRIFGVYKK